MVCLFSIHPLPVQFLNVILQFNASYQVDSLILPLVSRELRKAGNKANGTRRDFTFVCPTEILAFNDSLQAFKAINTTVIGKPIRSCFVSSNLLILRLF